MVGGIRESQTDKRFFNKRVKSQHASFKDSLLRFSSLKEKEERERKSFRVRFDHFKAKGHDS